MFFKLSSNFRRKCINGFCNLEFFVLCFLKVKGKVTKVVKACFSALFLIKFIHSYDTVMAWFVLFFGSACGNGPSMCQYTVHYIKLQSSKFTMELLYCYMVISGIRRPYFLFRLRYIMLAVKTECHIIVGNYIHFFHTFILEYWDLP